MYNMYHLWSVVLDCSFSSTRTEKSIKPQRGKNSNPSEESPGTSKPKEDQSWHQKEENYKVPKGDFRAQQSLIFKFLFEFSGAG